MQRLGIKIQMAFAVAVRDSITGRPVSGSRALVTLPEDPGNRPITKRDGYYVVLEGRKEISHFIVSAPGYQTRDVMVDKAMTAKTGEIQYVWLIPDRTYPEAGKMLRIKVSGAAAGEKLTFVTVNRRLRLKLLSDFNSEDTSLNVFISDNRDISGREYALVEVADTGTSGALSGRLVFTEKEKSGAYGLVNQLGLSGQARDFYLYPADEATADDSGAIDIYMGSDCISDDSKIIIIRESGQTMTHVIGDEGSCSINLGE